MPSTNLSSEMQLQLSCIVIVQFLQLCSNCLSVQMPSSSENPHPSQVHGDHPTHLFFWHRGSRMVDGFLLGASFSNVRAQLSTRDMLASPGRICAPPHFHLLYEGHTKLFDVCSSVCMLLLSVAALTDALLTPSEKERCTRFTGYCLICRRQLKERDKYIFRQTNNCAFLDYLNIPKSWLFPNSNQHSLPELCSFQALVMLNVNRHQTCNDDGHSNNTDLLTFKKVPRMTIIEISDAFVIIYRNPDIIRCASLLFTNWRQMYDVQLRLMGMLLCLSYLFRSIKWNSDPISGKEHMNDYTRFYWDAKVWT